MRIEPLGTGEEPPMDLLLLADPSEKLVSQYLKRGSCYVAKTEEAGVIGTYVLLPTRPDTAELVNVAVDERRQGRGIGKALVLHAVETARREGYRTIEVGTGNSGIGQLALYQKCGFRIVGVDFDFFVRHYDEPIVENDIPCRDMIRMCQDL
ncbi:GNAT family N-acetyltransferase [Cohnella hashimotonis]|uniref:GNAT family N-acetyltransferase n=1 Tax=Cohnella hashimotonis TaxID=2826895 RepID=A0ABT6THH4_9BACL|nr:GNAT family N-acetyltransferase [Cohnella hashimotonis]MDI4646296.1 GNAT family N-acetyltransferase [Cohnella hashimotonis]